MSERTPIFVWTMGKVGTSTVSRGLARAGIPALHMHSIRPSVQDAVRNGRWDAARRRYREVGHSLKAISFGDPELASRSLRPQGRGIVHVVRREWTKARNVLLPPRIPHIEASKRAASIICEGVRPIRVITMVREPIARNISAFFENLQIFALSHEVPTDQLVDAFKSQYPHNVPLDWFDREIKYGVNFDVFAEPFDCGARIGRYRKDGFEFLIMRMDAELERQEAEVSDFVGQQVFLAVRNSSETKPYAAAYRAFKDRLSLDRDYIERMYNSKFARHFWTGDELSRLAQRRLPK